MKTRSRILRAAQSLGVLAAFATAALAGAEVRALNPANLVWIPKHTLPPGAVASVTAGDLAKGPYDFIAKFPSAYRVPLHWQTNAVAVVLLEGQMIIEPQQGAPVTIERQGFIDIPAGLRYAATCPEGCTFLAHGVLPFDIHYVHSADDPRLASRSHPSSN
jgi:hypothetical protein